MFQVLFILFIPPPPFHIFFQFFSPKERTKWKKMFSVLLFFYPPAGLREKVPQQGIPCRVYFHAIIRPVNWGCGELQRFYDYSSSSLTGARALSLNCLMTCPPWILPARTANTSSMASLKNGLVGQHTLTLTSG